MSLCITASGSESHQLLAVGFPVVEHVVTSLSSNKIRKTLQISRKFFYAVALGKKFLDTVPLKYVTKYILRFRKGKRKHSVATLQAGRQHSGGNKP